MRLAIIRRRYNPYGGAERFIERLLPRLSDAGIQPTLITEEWTQKGLTIPLLNIKSRGFMRAVKFRSFQSAVARALDNGSPASKFDLVQSHERIVDANIFRLGDGVHAAWVNRLISEATGLKKTWLTFDPYHRAVIDTERKMAANPRLHYVANSSLVEQELRDYLGVPPERITTIPNGVDTEFFRPATSDEKVVARKALSRRINIDIAPQMTIGVGIGSGFIRKGFLPLIQACPSLDDFILILCGQDRSMAEAAQLISRLGLSKKVFLMGAENEVRSVLWASDILALPSLYDPSSNAVLEALACGVPVVITRDVGMADEIISAGAGVICERESSSISSALQACRDRAIQQRMGGQARRYAVEFDQSSIIQQWIKLYRSIQPR